MGIISLCDEIAFTTDILRHWRSATFPLLSIRDTSPAGNITIGSSPENARSMSLTFRATANRVCLHREISAAMVQQNRADH